MMEVGLNFGLSLSEFSPEQMIRIAREAERLGYESLWCGDHLILPPEIPLRDTSEPDKPVSRVTPSETTRVLFQPRAPMPDVLTVFSHMAAVTSRLVLGTDVYVLALRNPMVVARQAATVDWLSGGRLMLGVGLGWIPGEYEAAGIPWSERAGRTEESIEVMRSLWTEEETSHTGRYFEFGRSLFWPKPARPGGPPILIGGESAAALERAARLGDGWCARYQSPDSLRARLKSIGDMRAQHGTGGRPFEVMVRIRPDVTPGALAALDSAGVTRANVSLQWITDFDWILAEMIRVSGVLGLAR
jgi:probable F420-dependent oxidoreductase